MTQHRDHYYPVPALLARDFVQMGHQVVALTTQLADGASGLFNEEGSDIHYLSGTRADVADQTFWRKSAEIFDEIHSKSPFDLVLGRGNSVYGFLSFSRFSGQVPVICHEGTYPDLPHKLHRTNKIFRQLLFRPTLVLSSLFRWKYRHCLTRADRTVCNSPALANALSNISCSSRPRTVFIPYGFNLVPYNQALSRVAKQVPPRLVFVGRLAWDKGVIAIIEILARLHHRDVVLDVIGPGSVKVVRRIRKRAAQLGVQDRVHLVGPIHNTKLPDSLAGAFALLLPSTHAEGLNKSIMEAMSARLPVITYDIPGMDALVKQGETGWRVPVYDIGAAAVAIDQLLDHPDLAERMGNAGQSLIQDYFSPSRVRMLWNLLFDEITTEKGQSISLK
jgi:glycosyltransferase involved in cell wall biosynthesis